MRRVDIKYIPSGDVTTIYVPTSADIPGPYLNPALYQITDSDATTDLASRAARIARLKSLDWTQGLTLANAKAILKDIVEHLNLT